MRVHAHVLTDDGSVSPYPRLSLKRLRKPGTLTTRTVTRLSSTRATSTWQARARAQALLRRRGPSGRRISKPHYASPRGQAQLAKSIVPRHTPALSDNRGFSVGACLSPAFSAGHRRPALDRMSKARATLAELGGLDGRAAPAESREGFPVGTPVRHTRNGKRGVVTQVADHPMFRRVDTPMPLGNRERERFATR